MSTPFLNWQEWFSLKIRIFVLKYLCFSVMTARQRQFTGAAGTLLTVPRSASKRTGPGNTRRHARGPWEGGTESEGGHTWSEGGHTLNQVLKLSQSVADSYCTEITIFCGDSFGYWGRWGICLKTWKVPTVLFLESHKKKSLQNWNCPSYPSTDVCSKKMHFWRGLSAKIL